MQKVYEFFREDNGHFSSQRLVFILANTAIWTVWTYVSLHQGTMQALDPALLAGLAIMQGGKVGQKLAEAK